MSKKYKKFLCAVLFFCIFIFISLITIYLVINYYIKYSIEKEINKTLNAKLKISDLEFSFKNNTLLVSDIFLFGNADLKKDTLIFIKKIFIKINPKSNFKKVVFDEIKFETGFVKNIVKNEISCLNNIIKKNDSLLKEKNVSENFKFYVNNLTFENIKIIYDNISVCFDMNFNFDTSKTKNSEINIKMYLDSVKNSKTILCKGFLSMYLGFDNIFNTNMFSLNVVADSILIKSRTDNVSFFANINYNLKYKKNEQISLNIKNLKVASDNDSIFGDCMFCMSKTDNVFINNIVGKINLEQILNQISCNNISKFIIDACNSNSSELTIKTNAIFDDNKQYYLSLSVTSDRITKNFNFKNKIISGTFENVIYNIQNLFTRNKIEIENALNINYLKLNNLYFIEKKSFLGNYNFTSKKYFSELNKILLKSTIKIDTAIIKDYFLYDLKINCNLENNILKVASNPFRINNLLFKNNSVVNFSDFQISSKSYLNIPNTKDNRKYLLFFKNYSAQEIKFNDSGTTKFVLDISGSIKQPKINIKKL